MVPIFELRRASTFADASRRRRSPTKQSLNDTTVRQRDDDDDDHNGEGPGPPDGRPPGEPHGGPGGPEGGHGEEGGGEHGNPFGEILEPFVFNNEIGELKVLQSIVLSPHAFSTEILSPEFFNVSFECSRRHLEHITKIVQGRRNAHLHHRTWVQSKKVRFRGL